jgi:hypothetical protein
MNRFAALLLVLVSLPVLAQPAPGWQGQPGRHAQRDFHGKMPPPGRRMSWEERQRLREQVRSGNMTREEARARWREQRERRGIAPGRSPEERQKLRRDVQEANRDLERR